MKKSLAKGISKPSQAIELIQLRKRLDEAQKALHAIHSGEVDTLVVPGAKGPLVFTLEGADHSYRVLIESMNEGALILDSKGVILYSNQNFADIIKCPLEQVLGTSFLNRFSDTNHGTMRLFLKSKSRIGSKIHADLEADDASMTPVQISICKLPKYRLKDASIGVVVSDMTAVRKSEEMLRALNHRVVQAQEAERGRVAYELHDGITQLLCGILFRSQALVNHLSPQGGLAMEAAIKLNEVADLTAQEVERIARNLKPGILEDLGLVAALQNAIKEFSNRTKVIIKLTSLSLSVRLPLDIEVAIYRIFQESLRNVEKHSQARHVTVRLSKQGNSIKMVIKDDGIGITSNQNSSKHAGRSSLGLLSMRERATQMGGTLKLNSLAGLGTEIVVKIPLAVGN